MARLSLLLLTIRGPRCLDEAHFRRQMLRLRQVVTFVYHPLIHHSCHLVPRYFHCGGWCWSDYLRVPTIALFYRARRPLTHQDHLVVDGILLLASIPLGLSAFSTLRSAFVLGGTTKKDIAPRLSGIDVLKLLVILHYLTLVYVQLMGDVGGCLLRRLLLRSGGGEKDFVVVVVVGSRRLGWEVRGYNAVLLQLRLRLAYWHAAVGDGYLPRARASSRLGSCRSTEWGPF